MGGGRQNGTNKVEVEFRYSLRPHNGGPQASVWPHNYIPNTDTMKNLWHNRIYTQKSKNDQIIVLHATVTYIYLLHM